MHMLYMLIMCYCTPHPPLECLGLGLGDPPPLFLGGEFKERGFGKIWDSGRAVRGQNYEKMGYDISFDRILPRVQKMAI